MSLYCKQYKYKTEHDNVVTLKMDFERMSWGVSRLYLYEKRNGRGGGTELSVKTTCDEEEKRESFRKALIYVQIKERGS